MARVLDAGEVPGWSGPNSLPCSNSAVPPTVDKVLTDSFEWDGGGVIDYAIPGIDAVNALVPQRWPYPRSEQTFNETNVLAAISANGGDDAWDGRVWWDASDHNSGPAR